MGVLWAAAMMLWLLPFTTMLYQITSFLLEVAAGLLSGVCLLRLYMQYQRIPMSARSGNPMGKFIFAFTDWLVLPLRKVVPAVGRWDMASLVAAFLVQLAQFAVLWALLGMGASVVSVLVYAIFGLARMAVSGLTGLVIVYAVLSWVQTQSYLSDLLERLVMPVLIPIRRVLPLVGGIDLSPLVLLVLLQVAGIILGYVQAAVLVAI
jgi:YggT family protein